MDAIPFLGPAGVGHSTWFSFPRKSRVFHHTEALVPAQVSHSRKGEERGRRHSGFPPVLTKLDVMIDGGIACWEPSKDSENTKDGDREIQEATNHSN